MSSGQVIDCELIPKRRESGTKLCSLVTCDNIRPTKRPIWCSDRCSKWFYQEIGKNHHWSSARKAAKRRDKYQCVKCGSKEKLEVNHIKPLVGRGYHDGCEHHLAGLETLCRQHHQEETNKQRKERKQ